MREKEWEQTQVLCPYYSLSNVRDDRILCICRSANTRTLTLSFRGRTRRAEHMRVYCQRHKGFPQCPVFEMIYSLERSGSTLRYDERAKEEIAALYLEK